MYAYIMLTVLNSSEQDMISRKMWNIVLVMQTFIVAPKARMAAKSVPLA